VDRRALLLASASFLAMSQQPALAVATNTVCASDTATEAEDAACRQNALARDAGKQESYGQVSSRKFELVEGVPVAKLDQTYINDTLKLSEDIEQYCSMDVYDKARPGLIRTLKSDGTTWVTKYARGGSARSQSARRMYIAVDAVVGHLASNGYAPLPPVKVKAVIKSVDEAKDFLSKGL